MSVDAEREEIRFQAAIAGSTPGVEAVADHVRCEGFDAVEVMAQEAFVDRRIFKDAGADIRYRIAPADAWRHIEVKVRTFDFVSAQTFPYPTIIVDRATKGVVLDLYFIVNRCLTHAAVISKHSHQHWKRVTVFDRSKGYDCVTYQCPKELAIFVTLNKPEPKPKKRVVKPIVNTFFGHCLCGDPGLYFVRGQSGGCRGLASRFTSDEIRETANELSLGLTDE